MKRKADSASGQETKRSKLHVGTEHGVDTRGTGQKPHGPPKEIEPGMTGIWATCTLGKEGLCVQDLRSMFERYAEEVYTGHAGAAEAENAEDQKPGQATDIEADIRDELRDMQSSRSRALFTAIRIDTQCLVFFQTREPVEPVSFVRHICQDVAQNGRRKSGRFVQRLTPVAKVAKATVNGLAELAREVLEPYFHAPGAEGKKFAIRPNLRNHKILSRDSVIQQVASAVGPGHTVDLKHYDLLILVEVYKNICGMSVVGADYERLKRYNLSELGRTANADV